MVIKIKEHHYRLREALCR